ncbi:endolytic transglycosylase MltG [Bifidobacterium callimiconis]|uniref:endolytic transglycosylase MltG n=1 Tax=Bifidobacterium callimiconis TaxID=2306973 RepID=UPI001BDCF3D0|nr:endolytic transglycosylase MltG [Bifidobacterium callimiconis]MBT1176387.1 endolytic transglycosylase MltG [Bifidobacterium callimiconis]
MADDMQDFFAEQAEWVGGDGEPEPAPGTPPRPPRSRKEMQKYRRKQQRARQVKVIIAVIFVVLVGLCGWMLFSKLGSVRNAVQVTRTEAADYPGPGSGDVEFTVENGQNSVQIGDNLEKKGIVKSSAAFQQAVKNAGLENQLQPGVFELKYRMKADAVAKVLTDSSNAKGFLVVNPGERLSAVLDQAASLSGIDRSEFQAIVDNKGDGILPSEAGGSFEGWLEPGNYNVKEQKSAGDIMKMMVDKRIAKLDQLGVPTGDDRERILKIASIAEGEVNKSDYYGKVTRVIENRLAKDMPLGMDSVIAYGNNVEPRALTKAMLNDTSNPYNSRSQKGLPPTPINQPGDNAIKAAMNPEEGDWLYFVTVNLDTGETKFTADENEFQQFSKEYEDWEAAN